jgi:dipeptidyl aminopeptidase/acylaminoacyl peptidase
VSSKLYRTGFDPSTGTASPERIALTAGARRVREPALSPVGDEMLVRVQDPQEDLALIRPDGTEIKRLTNDVYADRTARWSPDGKRIVFRSNRSGRFELWSMLADGTGSRQLTTSGSIYALFTPDGQLTGYSDQGPVVLDPPEGKPSNWGLAPEFRPLSWSPDQGYVAGRMPSRRGSGIALFVCRSGSQDCWELSPAVTNPSITWLKDNQRLLFSARSGVSIADVKNRTIRLVLSEVNGDVHSRFVLSHDEKSLYFVISEDEEDIWMAKR